MVDVVLKCRMMSRELCQECMWHMVRLNLHCGSVGFADRIQESSVCKSGMKLCRT